MAAAKKEVTVNTTVTREIAEELVTKWLDYKRVRKSSREKNEDHVEALIDGFEEGLLTLNESTFEITQKLSHDTGGDNPVTELVFKPRAKTRELNSYLKKVKVGNTDERLLAYTAALTGKGTGLISNLDSVDNSLSGSIVIFFIS